MCTLLSVNPGLTPDDVNEILTDTNSTDPIDPNICWSDGRLNVHKALVAAIPETGYVRLEKEYYNCDCNVGIFLADCNLADEDDVNVNVVSSGGDEETVTLTEIGADIGVFSGSISTSSGDPNTQDGILQVSDGNTIMVTYEDENDANDDPAEVNDTATVDCVAPDINSNIEFEVLGPDITVTFTTDGNATGRVLYGTGCNDLDKTCIDYGTGHSIRLRPISTWTDYYFKVTATDLAGNEVVDDNDGNCYQFSTRGPEDINVPGDYNTIQGAIDQSWDGGRVIVDEGTYNEQINFLGKAITVMSTDPNDWDVVEATFIDANGPNAVTFDTFEYVNSVLTGFRVKGNPGVYSTGIFSRPTVSKCVIEGYTAVKVQLGSAVVEGCKIRSLHQGVYLFVTQDATVRNCEINGGFYGIYLVGYNCGMLIENNWIYDNTMGITTSNPMPVVATVRNNTFTKNNRGINESSSSNSMLTVSNCIFWDNSVYDLYNSSATYSCIEDCSEASGTGNICGDANDPCFVDADANDFHIDIHSPCVDAGNPSGDYNDQNDIDGEARVINGRVDMGADEVVLPDAHWWKFDEGSGTTAEDYVGDSNGTLRNDPCWVDGIFGYALEFFGDTSSPNYVSVSSLNAEYDYADTFSVAGWFTTSQTTGIQTIVGQWTQKHPSYPPIDFYYGWQVLVENSKVVARFGTLGATSEMTGTSDVNDGNWHHFALVYPTSSSNATLYVDGESEGTPGTHGIVSTNSKFRIGDGSHVSEGSPVVKGGPFNGDIDDVMIYERALSAEEVELLWNAGQQ